MRRITHISGADQTGLSKGGLMTEKDQLELLPKKVDPLANKIKTMSEAINNLTTKSLPQPLDRCNHQKSKTEQFAEKRFDSILQKLLRTGTTCQLLAVRALS
jgi:hypothetical protein